MLTPSRFDAVPSTLCSAPAKRFWDEVEALAWAERTANQHGIAYDVYRVLNCRHHKLASFVPQDRRATDE